MTQQQSPQETYRQLQAQNQAIEALAKETHADIDVVRELFRTEHSRLESNARITTYLSIIAARLVRNTLTSGAPHSIQ